MRPCAAWPPAATQLRWRVALTAQAKRGVSRRDVLAAAGGIGLAACTSPHGHDVSWWAMGTTGENAPLLLPDFVRTSGFHVDLQAVPWTGAHEKLLTGFAGNSLPDVMMLNTAWLPEMALLGALAPPPPALLADQLSGARAAVTLRGRAMAVPWTADSWVQFYRRDLLREAGYAAPPLDWAEWTKMAQTIVRRHPDRFATLHLLDWPEPLFAYAAQTGEPLLRDHDGRGNFRSAGFRAALAFYKQGFDLKLTPKITGAEAGDTYTDLRRGWFAIMPSDAVFLGDVRRPEHGIAPGSWGAAATPGPHGAGPAWVRGTCLAVSRVARNPDAAWRLVSFLASAPLQARLYGMTGDLPTRPSAWMMMPGDAATRLFADLIGEGVPVPAVPEWERITGEVQLVAEAMVRGAFGVDAAAAEMDARVDRILAKRRSLLDGGRVA